MREERTRLSPGAQEEEEEGADEHEDEHEDEDELALLPGTARAFPVCAGAAASEPRAVGPPIRREAAHWHAWLSSGAGTGARNKEHPAQRLRGAAR